MKKFAAITLLLVLASLLLKSQHIQIPFEEIKEIADRNAKALWGQAFPAEPIPYYSAQDEIIAYMFNYSIGKPFPNNQSVIHDCKIHKENNKRNLQWGGENYGRILMGAKNSLPPIIEYSQSLSAMYAEGFQLKELAVKELGSNYSLKKVYYINGANQWFCYTNGLKDIYIKLFPPIEILDQQSFQQAISDKKVFIEPNDYSSEWISYKTGKELDTKAATYISDYELCRFYDWSYGCSPTAAAMLYSWWDYRSIYSTYDFGRLIQYYFKRYDDIEVEWDYQIPWVQRELAIHMNTDTLAGTTSFGDINDGIEDVASMRDYEFDANDYITSEWTRLKDEIDENRPLIASIPNHSTCCIGYNSSTDHFANHYTHQGSIVWTHKDELDGVVEVKPENNNGQGITLTSPVGDPNYNATGSGEIFYPGEEYNITWDYESTIPSTTSIFFNTKSNGGFVEEVIVYNTDNDGLYSWMVPTGFGSEECRVGIINYNASSDMLAIDGSQGMFTIYDPPVIEELGSSTETTDYNPDYFQFDLEEDAWCAVGIRNMTDNDWKLKLYQDLTYLNLIEESNMPPEISEVDFVVLDGNHLPDHTYGVKVDRLDGDDGGKIGYDGTNNSLSLGTNYISFPLYSVLKMFDIHLVPGYYTFTSSLSSGSGEASIALFSSSNGDYIQKLDDAIGSSTTGGWGADETFTVCISTEDNYGFCIWTSYPSSQTWQLDIIEEHPGVWEGDYNTNWSNSNNWSLNIVPSLGTDVNIPAGTPYNPYVTEYSFCENITIESGATLRIYSGNLVTGGDMLVKGSVRIYEDQSLTVNGDITWTSTASEYMENNSSINVGENWTFDYGSSIQMSNGKVRFAGIEHSMIYSRSINSWFNEVEIDKFLETALVSYEMTPGLQNLQINGDFNCLVGNFMCPSMMSIIFKGQDLNVTDDFDFNCGAGYFRFEGDANQYLFFNPTSNFNNLVIESSGTVYLQDPIIVDQNIYIHSGILASNSNTIEVGGSWYNDAGVGAFYQSSGIVRFTGYGNRECTGDEFHILELDKTSGELRFPEGITECDVYDYTQGTIRVNGGSFIANDLEDSGIFGTIFLTAGEIIYHQDESQFIDLAGDLTITDGTFTIYGGGDNSYWPYTLDASITMSDGVLDFVDNGIRVHNTTYSLSENISGGRIRTAYDFEVYRDDFNPTGGTIELYGTTDGEIRHADGSNLYSLEINKSSTDYTQNQIKRNPRSPADQKDSKANTITASTNLDLLGDFTLNAGTFMAPAVMHVSGNWTNNTEPEFFAEGTNLVIINGPSDQIINKENFYNFELNKSGGELLIPLGTINIENFDWTAGAYHINGGTLIIDDLMDNGIYGIITVSDGKLFLTQGVNSMEYIDLGCDLTISGGEMRVFGGNYTSYWPWNGSASLTMSDGILDFVDQGIMIYNAGPWIFTENITGGTIRTSSNFDVYNTDFNPTGGTVELYGPDDAWVSVTPGSNLHNLVIHKSGTVSKSSTPIEDQEMGIKESGLKGNIVTLSGGTVINGNLNVQESSLNLFSGQAKVLGNVYITNNGIMSINSNGELLLGSSSSLLCETGGIFETFGETGNEAFIHTESGYFDFKITNGGTIRAAHTLFENMNIYGIHITSDGLVDEAFPFNNCTFGSGQTGGTYLTIDSDQSLTADGVVFNPNTWGGNSNVRRTVDQGEITFTNFSGDFSGEAYDDDPFGRIHWDDGGREIALTVMLEGPFSGSSMTTSLNNLGFLPLAQPYHTSPWNYSGTESVLNMPNANIIDWVLIEYRDATNAASATGTTVIGHQAAFLMNDGTIVDMDGISNLDFPYTINDQLYIVIYHRNHLSVMSAFALAELGGIFLYDFTTPSGQAYGAGAQKDLGGGIYGMFSGDANADGIVNDLDKTEWKYKAGEAGYLSEDLQLNGQVDNQDKNELWIHNIDQNSQIPD
jgi:hypothetical protein